MKVAGLLLAAGAGRRFGMAKALALFHGRPLVRHGADTLAAGGCDPVLVVVGAQAAAVRAAAAGLSLVDNPDWATGMGSSLRAGLTVLADGPADAVVVLLADMPGVSGAAVARMVAVAGPDALAAGGYGDRRGHPVLLGRAHWAGVAATATGDRGARDYLRERAVRVVEVGDVADDTDADTPHLLSLVESAVPRA